MGDLSVDTRVEGSDGHYQAVVSRDWEIWGPNGGYIASLALRAAGAHSRFDRPASLVGNFLGVATFEPVDITVTTRRAAKRAEAMRVELTQHGQPVFDAMVWAVGDVHGLEHDVARRRDLGDPETMPSPEELLAEREDSNPYHRFWSNFDARIEREKWIDDWQNREPADPEHGQWYRYVPTSTFDDPWVDACRYVILADTLGWPAVCRYHVNDEYIAPSIDLSIGFHRARPNEPWLYGYCQSVSAANGLIGCESRVWSRDGALLVHGTSQLLCRPAPPLP